MCIACLCVAGAGGSRALPVKASDAIATLCVDKALDFEASCLRAEIVRLVDQIAAMQKRAIEAENTAPKPAVASDERIAGLERGIADLQAALAIEREAHAATRRALERGPAGENPPAKPLPAKEQPPAFEAPAPFAHAASSPPVPAVASVPPAPAAVPIRQRLEAGTVASPNFTIQAHAGPGGLVLGTSGTCYAVMLRQAASTRPFRFASERYVLQDRDADARESYAAFLSDVVARLPAGTETHLYVRAEASGRRFSRPHTLASARSFLKSITYLPREPRSGRYAVTPVVRDMPQRYGPEHLALLRAATVKDLLGKDGDVSRMELLEGEARPDTDPQDDTFTLFLCATWPR